MLFAIIFGAILGGGAAYLQLQYPEMQIDIGISVALFFAVMTLARMLRGWGLLAGLAAVAGMWVVIMTGGFIGDPEQMLEILRRRFDPFPDRVIAFVEDLSHYTSRYELNGEIPPEVLRMIWGAEAFAMVLAGLMGAANGKRSAANAGRAAPPQRQTRTSQSRAAQATSSVSRGGADAAFGVASGGSRRGNANKPWSQTTKPARPARPQPARPQDAGARPARVRESAPVAPVDSPTIVSTRPDRGSGDYVN